MGGGAPTDLGKYFSAIWLSFVADTFTAPAGAFLRLSAFFARRGYVLALPELDPDWCLRPQPRGHRQALLLRLRSWLLAAKGRYQQVLAVAAFKPGSLRCSATPRLHGHSKSSLIGRRSLLRTPGRLWSTTVAAPTTFAEPRPPLPGCIFGLSARQLAGRHAGAGRDSYFLAGELPEM